MRRYLLPAVAMLALSCATDGQKESPERTGTPVETAAEQASYPFPVYTDFGQLKPWLERENDTTYVVNFWATWCKPCVKELPYFEQLQQKATAEGRKVQVVLVSLDFGKELDSKLLPFVQKHQLRGKVVALLDDDYNKWIDQVSPDWSGAIPATLIYNRKERLFFPDAFDDYEDLKSALSGL